MSDLSTSAYCGLFCETCSVYIFSQTDENALEALASKFGMTKEEMRCNGCRSDKLSSYCQKCLFTPCALEKGILNCEDCAEFPCDKLKEFQKQMPHRAELFESAECRKSLGIDKWKEKITSDYSCEKCGNVNSPYFVKCAKCGNVPSSPFFERHSAEIKKHLKID